MATAQDWSKAQVVEPLGFVDDQLHTVGALVLRADTPVILSLNPGEDFELNTDIIQQWKMVFQNSVGEVIGDADYHLAIKELQDFILDQQNGSLLIRALTDDELADVYAQTFFE